jgi:hypothetical protein
MNPLRSLRNYFIGGSLAKTDDVFEQVKAEVLFNFTFIFLLTNIPYLFVAYKSAVLLTLGVSTLTSLVIVLILLKKTSNVRTATYFFLLNFLLQVGGHYVIDNGDISVQGMLFFLMFSLCGYLLMDRKWGFGISLLVLVFFLVGVYNTNNGNSLFSLPPELADPKEIGAMRYFSIIPILLNIYLISEFVKAKQKAEKQLSEQKKLVEMKQKEVLDSIHYAKRIQSALMPTERYIYEKIKHLIRGSNKN